MNNLEPVHTQAMEPVSAPSRLPRREERKHGRALGRLDHRADYKFRELQIEAELGQMKVETVGNVGSAALSAQALISSRERMLVEAEPGAIHGIAAISGHITLALGAIVDKTMREVTK